MDVDTPLEANAQFAEAGKPGVRTLDHPAVSSQPFLAFYAAPGNARRDPSLFQVLPAAGVERIKSVTISRINVSLRGPIMRIAV